MVWAVKPAEDGIEDGVIVRLWNLSDDDEKCVLDAGWKMKSAARTTHVETDIEPMEVKKGRLTLNMGHNRIETYKVK